MPKLFAFAVAAVAGAVAAQATQPPLVPARLFHIRDGLGNVFEKLKGGGAVRVAYVGGSITAQRGWPPKTLAWFRQR